MSADFKHRLATAGRQHPRAAGLDEKFAKLLPEVELGMGPDDFANLAARALEPKLPDVISVAHIHAARVSVREQAAIIVERLRRVGQASFRTLTRDCDTTLLVVARFLALLEIYRDGLISFDQPTPLGELYVRWIGDDDVNIDAMREIDEFDTTQVQDFRTQLGDVDVSEPLSDETGEMPNE
jgi:segregation and condensation protein A